MPQISNGVFTNGMISQPDLLQQAWKRVIDDEEQQNKYVIWVQTDEASIGQTVHAIPEAATLFGINANEEVMYQDNAVTTMSTPVNIDMANYSAVQQQSSESPQESVVHINYCPIAIQQNPDDSNSLAIDSNLQEWHTPQKSSPSENLQELVLDAEPLTLTQIDLHNEYYNNPQYKISNETAGQQSDSVQQNSTIVVKRPKIQSLKVETDSKNGTEKVSKKVSKNSYCVKKTLTQKTRLDSVAVTQEQILQKFPKILPLSLPEKIIQTTPSVLRANKGVNILQNSIKTMPTIISNQVINGPQILAQPIRSIPNQTVLTSCIPANVTNNTTGSTNFVTKQIHLPSINNGNSISTDLWKHVPVSSQILNVSAASVGKKIITPSELSTTAINSKQINKNIKTIAKTPDQKPMKANPRSILKSAQTLSMSSISVLKPEVKIAPKNTNNQKSIATTTLQNRSNSANRISNTSTNGSKQSSTSQNTYMYVVQNGTNQSTPLSDAHLKRVRQILGQHSPNAETKDKIVLYRVVSLEDVGIKSSGNTLARMSTNSSEPLSSNQNNIYIVPEKNRGGKRGRPKKSAVQPPAFSPQPPVAVENEQEEIKGKQMKIIARTRSGRLSRPPKHMVKDYKRLPFDKYLACAQIDPDDSDGGYSEFITHNNKLEEQESPTPLLDGLGVPKRNISDRFRCPTCTKCYLGRSRMLSHFEKHPDHGSPEQHLLSSIPEPMQKQNGVQDPLKRKGKKRGPWAYATPEAKSQRRQKKLEEAIVVCEQEEIIKALEKVLDMRALFGLMASKFDCDLKGFLDQAKHFGDHVREKISTVLTPASVDEEKEEDIIDFKDERLGIYLGVDPGVYKIINNRTLKEEPSISTYDDIGEPALKIRKVDNGENIKENNEEQMSSGVSEMSELSVSEFLNESRVDSTTNSTCPAVLSALTLIPTRNQNIANNVENNMSNNASNVLISSSEIQNRISDNPGFRKVNIKISNFEKSDSHNDTFVKLSDSVEMSNDIPSFRDVEDNYGQSNLDHMEQTFRRLEPTDRSFDNAVAPYQKQDTLANLEEEMRSELDSIETGSQSFTKDYHNPTSMTISELSSIETQTSSLHPRKVMSSRSVDNILSSIRIPEESVPSISNNCNSNAFESNENLDMSKVTHYLFTSIVSDTNGEIEKNLSIDDHSTNLSSVDVSNIDEIVEERLQNIVISENVLENNLSDNTNSYTDLNFEALTTEDFNENTTT